MTRTRTFERGRELLHDEHGIVFVVEAVVRYPEDFVVEVDSGDMYCGGGSETVEVIRFDVKDTGERKEEDFEEFCQNTAF